jgi:hypothetical protein
VAERAGRVGRDPAFRRESGKHFPGGNLRQATAIRPKLLTASRSGRSWCPVEPASEARLQTGRGRGRGCDGFRLDSPARPFGAITGPLRILSRPMIGPRYLRWGQVDGLPRRQVLPTTTPLKTGTTDRAGAGPGDDPLSPPRGRSRPVRLPLACGVTVTMSRLLALSLNLLRRNRWPS